VLALRLEVRCDHAGAGLLADLDRLAHRVEQRHGIRAVLARHVPERIAAFTPLVRNVDAVERGQLARELDDFIGRAPSARLVFETGRHADRALLQRLLHQRAHARDLIRLRRPLHIVSHHAAANRAATDEQHRVRTDADFLELGALVGQRPRRTAVLVDDHGGDALRDKVRRRLANRIRIAESTARSRSVVCVRVNVDESRHDVLAGGIDHPRGLGAFEFSNRGDAPVQNADVGGEPRIAGPVYDAAVANQQIEALSWLRANERKNAATNAPASAVRYLMAAIF
jgi:hypothetical protein